MKRICLILILINAAVLLTGQSVWTGNAAVSIQKEFESYYSDDSATGRYLGASNSFPGSTEVTVTNPRNGKSVSVSIVKRLSQPGLFLVLSPEAGKAIDLPDDDILNVEVVVRRKNEGIFNSYSDDLPYSEDPDLNPSAEIVAETSTETSGELPQSEASITAQPVVTQSEQEPEIEVEPPAQTDVNEFIPPVVMNNEGTLYEEGYDPLVILEGEEDSEKSVPGEIVEIIDDPQALADAITGSVSEPDIPLPETYDETDLPGTYEPELMRDTVIGMTPEEEDSGEILDSSVILAEPGRLEPEELGTSFTEAGIDDLLITETADKEPEVSETLVPVPEIIESGTDDQIVTETLIEEPVVIEPVVTEPIVTAPAEEPDEEELPENVIYFLTPGDFRPPPQQERKEEKEKEKEKVKEKTIVALPVERSELEGLIVSELHNGGSYLQLGVYKSVDVLYSQIEQINDAYPSIVLTVPSGEEQLYKLLIGPISRDEKGIVMTRFRSSGYGDAFLYTPR
ncbi:MAG: hypothetical protein JEY91_17570 [Spirochaetaceae bacterium]|nr:hypothetical protein [Spirochaetaceae bacterium]